MVETQLKDIEQQISHFMITSKDEVKDRQRNSLHEKFFL